LDLTRILRPAKRTIPNKKGDYDRQAQKAIFDPHTEQVTKGDSDLSKIIIHFSEFQQNLTDLPDILKKNAPSTGYSFS
jgi:hypothetical protein